MRRFSVRWRNFRSLEDSAWLEVRPITVVIGANASGKTSLVAPLLLLKQTLASGDPGLALKTQGPLFNVGSYENLVFGHDKGRRLELNFRIVRNRPKDGPLDSIGTYPPGAVDLSFGAGERGSPPVLLRYRVRDIYGRPMLTRRRLRSGKYSLYGANAPKAAGELYTAIRRSLPHHFLFTVEAAFREMYSQSARLSPDKTRIEPRDIEHLELDESTQLYLSIVTHASALTQHVLRESAYIGPLREPPRRLYEVSGEKPSDVGTRGESAPEILYRQRDQRLLNLVNDWVARFDFGLKIHCTTLTEGAFNITLRRTEQSPEVNLADTGFGLSQILPIIVQGMHQQPNGLLIAEQPEIHLNPRLQSLLADLFAAISARRVSVLIETHSEHLLLRLRRLIADGTVKASDVALYFAERDKDESRIRRIELQANGHVHPESWPRGFFEDSLRESMALATAQSRRKPDAAS